MPNWIFNELVAYNLDSAAKTTLRTAFEQDEPFQAIHPMPQILKDTQSPTPYCLRKMFQEPSCKNVSGLDGVIFYSSLNRKDDWRQKILEIGEHEVIRRIREDKSIGKHEAHMAELAVKAIVKTEYANWYDWCVDNWGVKWDASEPMFEDEPLFKDESLGNPDLMVVFDTPWGPPTGILWKLSTQYPEATFILRWADRDDYGNGQGILCAEAGVVTELEIADKKEFLNKLVGSYDDEDEEDV